MMDKLMFETTNVDLRSYMDKWLAQNPGMEAADLFKLAMCAYVKSHPLDNGNGATADEMEAAYRLYLDLGSLSPDILQRKMKVPYQKGVEIIEALVDGGRVNPTLVYDCCNIQTKRRTGRPRSAEQMD